MNSKLLTGLFLVCALMASATSSAQIKASKNYVTKEVKVGNFNKIRSVGNTTVIYTQNESERAKVRIYGSDNLVDLLDISVVNETLVVKMKNGTRITSWKDGRLKVIASSPSLEAAGLQGSGDINIESDIKCNNFLLELQGSGDINAQRINCKNNMKADLRGSGDIEIKGGIEAINVALELYGSGDLKVYNVTAFSAIARLQGSGDLKVQGMNKVTSAEAYMRGSGDLDFVNLRANDVKVKLQGSGDLKISGVTRTADLALENSGDLDAKRLQAVNVTAVLSGSGDLTCYASGTLKAGVKGSGDIGYEGNPNKVELIGGRAKNIRKL